MTAGLPGPGMKPQVLIVDDDPDLVRRISLQIRRWGYASHSVAGAGELWQALDREVPSVILMDLMLGDDDGSQLMALVKQRLPGVPVIMITSSKSVEAAVKAMQLGANDYITKTPDFFAHLDDVVHRELASLEAVQEREAFHGLVGGCEPMRRLYQRIENMAPTDVSALILGETGTGKELVARAIHDLSRRRDRPFVAVNTAAIPHELIESQLFGHEKGAFTGAHQAHVGYCEQADGGTLFLDEIGEMSFEAQVKLFRFLQDHHVQRVGARAPRQVDVRVLAATSIEVRRQLTEHKLRPELYYRLKVVSLRLPPLRERGADIELLARHFLERSARRHGRGFTGISEGALEVLRAHRWEGNVRELKHAIEGAVVLHHGNALRADMLPEDLADETSAAGDDRGLQPVPAEDADPPLSERQLAEKRHLTDALEAADGDPEAAAVELGISRATIYRRMKKYGLSGKRTL